VLQLLSPLSMGFAMSFSTDSSMGFLQSFSNFDYLVFGDVDGR
jgi:hypothetical protein